MQTFFPYPSFYDTARTLDNQRLGKQRVEARQILNVIGRGESVGGWVNHPAVNMWRGYEGALKIYTNCMIVEWERRGFQNTMRYYDICGIISLPWWLNDSRIHDSHKSNLLRKYPEYYKTFDWHVPDDLPYFWPVESRLSVKSPKATSKAYASL